MNAIMRAALVIITASLLLGCATAAQRQLLGIAANNRDAAQKFQACVAAVYNQPELEPLRRDLPLNVENASLAQLANPNFVSAEETRLILANHPKYQECRQQFITQISEAMPTIAQIFLRGVTEQIIVLSHCSRRNFAGVSSYSSGSRRMLKAAPSYRLKASAS